MGSGCKNERAIGTLVIATGALVALAASAVTAQVPTASAVKGTIDGCVTIAVGEDGTGPGASAATTNQAWKCAASASDERVAGELDLVYNIAGWTDIGAIQWGYARISNDGGTWTGTWSSTISGDRDQVIMAWYVGAGDYEGWTYVETQHGQFQEDRETFGIAYPGEPPPTVVIVPLPEGEGEAEE